MWATPTIGGRAGVGDAVWVCEWMLPPAKRKARMHAERRNRFMAFSIFGRLIAGGVLLLAAGQARAADQWIEVSTPHFELYTNAGERKGREAVLYFEQVRSFFEQANPAKTAPGGQPLRIVAFKSEQAYKPYRLNDFAVAFYTHREDREYIVMQDIAPEHFSVAIHEYTHRIIDHSGLKLPVWLNEGLAQLYSTLEPKGKKAMVGNLIPGAMQVLVAGNWIPLAELVQVDHKSPLYNEKNQANVFYAESWALTHMLYLAPDYTKQFSAFLLSVASGKSMAETCAAVFGKPLAVVELDLQKYIRGNRFYGALFAVKLEKSEEEPEVVPVSPFESGMMLGDLLAIEHKTEAATAAYRTLEAEGAGKPEMDASLGYLAWESGNRDGARDYFSKAMAAGSGNEKMCYRLGMLEREPGGDKTVALQAFRRALALKPDDLDARLWLGITLIDVHDYTQSLAELTALKRVGPEQAQFLFSALAFDDMQLSRDADARKNAELAKKWAKNPEELQNAENILKYLDQKSNTTPVP